MEAQQLPFQELKQQALTRRANKLIEWLQRPEYSVYVDNNSIVQLIKLIDLIIWALERSIPLHEWKPFERQLVDARTCLSDHFETSHDEIINFKRVISEVIAILQSYVAHVNN